MLVVMLVLAVLVDDMLMMLAVVLDDMLLVLWFARLPKLGC